MHKFQCLYCGSEELVFTKWVKCLEKVIFHTNDHINYHQHIDDNDVLGAEHRFICGSCKKPVLFYGDYMTTEDELIAYINFTDQERAEILEDYEQIKENQAQFEGKMSDDEGSVNSDPLN